MLENKSIQKNLTSKMRVSSSWLNLEDTIFDSQNWHIKCATTKIEDKYIMFATSLKAIWFFYFYQTVFFCILNLDMKAKNKRLYLDESAN